MAADNRYMTTIGTKWRKLPGDQSSPADVAGQIDAAPPMTEAEVNTLLDDSSGLNEIEFQWAQYAHYAALEAARDGGCGPAEER
jgi:hypothetical protein